ncbi:hypothetical protein R3P38DRAFT_3190748 [Favolaschia claudopus]|uniref:Uncharacterized protein n=1 Tax=Favolaschia claudopus TaxID=2862362 RepID=A0AAW0BQ71_9AGAR
MAAPQVAQIPPTSWESVKVVRAYIESRNPPYPALKSAFLYPDGNEINQRVWAKVGVLHGLKQAYNLAHLDTSLWMDNARRMGTATCDLESDSYYVHTFPFDQAMRLEHGFYFLVDDQTATETGALPVNCLVTSMLLERSVPWRGNVLIFKCGKSKGNPIINIAESDAALVEVILQRLIRDGRLGQPRAIFEEMTDPEPGTDSRSN